MEQSMRLSINSEHDRKLATLLDAATARLQEDPCLLHRLYDGTLEMSCPLPPGYKPLMNRHAESLRARINEHWHMFEISEQSRGVSGGWMASCIPPAMYRIFLTAWLHRTGLTSTPSMQQLDLFA